jgi:hypothetical protein
MIYHLQQTIQPRIEEAIIWKREFGPLVAELVAYQRDSALALKAISSEIQLLRSNQFLQKRERSQAAPHCRSGLASVVLLFDITMNGSINFNIENTKCNLDL